MPRPVVPVTVQNFDHLHREIMILIDEVSHYGQCQGRLIVQSHPSDIVRFYAKQMQHLLSRLYQIAALSLLQRARHEGDMKHEDAVRESAKIPLEQTLPEADHPIWDKLDPTFCYLNQRSLELAGQAWHMVRPNNKPAPNIPHQHFRQIEEAFGKKSEYGQIETP